LGGSSRLGRRALQQRLTSFSEKVGAVAVGVTLRNVSLPSNNLEWFRRSAHAGYIDSAHGVGYSDHA
jgi:hypothetical protein